MASTPAQRAVIAHVKGTDLVRGRVWLRDYVPQNATKPYAVIDLVGDVNSVLSGDAQNIMQVSQSVQISVFQDGAEMSNGQLVNKYDSTLPGRLYRSFRNMTTYIGETGSQHKITVRLRSINNIPQPDEELVKQDSMTVEITMPVEAI